MRFVSFGLQGITPEQMVFSTAESLAAFAFLTTLLLVPCMLYRTIV
jgi:hypothetical protein